MDPYDINYGGDPLDNFNFDELRTGGAFFEQTFEIGANALGETPLPDVLEPTASPSPPAAFPPSGVLFSAVSQPRQQMSGSLGMPAQPQHSGSHGEVLSASEMRVSLPSAGTCESLLAASSQMDVHSHTGLDPHPPTIIQPLQIPPGGRIASMPPSASYCPQAGSQVQVLLTPPSACCPCMTPEAHKSPYPQLPHHSYGGAANAYFDGNRPRHPPHSYPVTADSPRCMCRNHRTIYGERGVVQRPTSDTNPLERGFGFYQHVSHEEPWTAKRLSFGKTIKYEKFSRQTRRKKHLGGDRFVSKDYYGNPPPRPEPWGQVRNDGYSFEYTEEGELKHALEVNELKWYLYASPSSPSIQHQWLARKPMPGDILLETKRRAGLLLWIGKVPSQSNYRYPSEDSNKCKFRGCPRKTHSIKAGEFRVIFDERHNVTGRDIDPYYNAGYVHLYCLEKHLDLVELFDHLDIRLDQRAFEKEDANYGELKPELAQATRRWMGDQWPRYLNWRRQDPRLRRRRNTKFIHSLTRTLTEADVKSEARGKPRQRAKRREAASQKATAINCDRETHLGDLDYECSYRQARLDGDDEGARRLYPGQEWDAYVARLALREERKSTHKEPRLAGSPPFNLPPRLDEPSEGCLQPAPAHEDAGGLDAAPACVRRANMAVPATQTLAFPGGDSLAATVSTGLQVGTGNSPSMTSHSQQAHLEPLELFDVDLEGLEKYTFELGSEETTTEAAQEPWPLPVTEETTIAECNLWADFLSPDRAGESVVEYEGAGEPRAVTIEAPNVGPRPRADNAEYVVGSPVAPGKTDVRPVRWDDALPPPPLMARPTLLGLKRRRDANDEDEAGSNARGKRRRSI